jgi:hypothetical protein
MSWKKILYSNVAATNEATQKGVKEVDLSPKYTDDSNVGYTDTGGNFTNASQTSPMVLKRATVANSNSGDDIGVGELYWGKGSPENMIIGSTNGSNQVEVTENYLTMGAYSDGAGDSTDSSYAIEDSHLYYDGSTKYLTTGGASNTGKGIDVGAGQYDGLRIVLDNTTTAVKTIDAGSFHVNGDGDTTTAALVSTTGLFSGLLNADAGIEVHAGSANQFTVSPTGNVAAAGDLDVEGIGDIAGTLTLSKSSGLGLDVKANAEVVGTLTVDGASTLTGAITTQGNLTVETSSGVDTFTVAAATGNTVIGVADTSGTLTVHGDTSIAGNLSHTGTTASFVGGAMTIATGASDTNLDIGSSATSSAVTGGFSNTAADQTLSIHAHNTSGANITLSAGSTWYAIDDKGEVVTLVKANSATTVNDTETTNSSGAMTFTVSSWFGDGDIEAGATFYSDEPNMNTITFNQAVQFEGEAIIVDSTNTALTDDVFHINKAQSGSDYGATNFPTFVMGTSGEAKADICRMTFASTIGRMEFGHGSTTNADTTTEDTAPNATQGGPTGLLHGTLAAYTSMNQQAISDNADAGFNATVAADNILAVSAGSGSGGIGTAGDLYMWIP